jgi:type II secretory pathway pseudopilin PulG
MRRRTRARGATLVEILVSLALVVIGLLGMFATLSATSYGSGVANQSSQAEARAHSLIEAIRLAPGPALDCLANTVATSWSSCETTCLVNLPGDGGVPSAQACIYTPASMALVPGPPAGPSHTTNQTVDRAGRGYTLVYDGSNPLGPSSTFVRRTGPGQRVYDIQITIGWTDDADGRQRTYTLRSGVFL